MCLRCARKPAVIMANILFHFIIPNQAIAHLFVVFEPPKFITMFICITCMSSEHCRINQLVKSVCIECRTIWGGHMTCLLSVANLQTSTNSWLWNTLLAFFLLSNFTTTFPLHFTLCWGTYATCTSSLLQRVEVQMMYALYICEFSLNHLLKLTFLP